MWLFAVALAHADIVVPEYVDPYPACGEPACPAGSSAVSRCPVTAACEAVQGANPTCTEGPASARVVVWCRPDGAAPSPTTPPTPPPAPTPAASDDGCATVAPTGVGLGLVLVALAARRARRR